MIHRLHLPVSQYASHHMVTCTAGVHRRPPRGNEDETHRIEPFRGVSLAELRELLQNEERVEIVTDHENYLHAEFTSLIMRFVDDVEFFSVAEEQVIHVRSASRLGRSDLGANRRRVEGLRTKLLGGK